MWNMFVKQNTQGSDCFADTTDQFSRYRWSHGAWYARVHVR